VTDRPADELPAGAEAILAECAPLVDAFAAAGRRLYLVGGLVRDLYGGTALDEVDLDFTTDAPPAEVKAAMGPIAEALWTQGERFGTIAAKVGGRLIEITTHRAEAYDPESRKPAVVFADDVLVDLSRRDFTINALAIELTAGTPRLIDPFDGVGDLRSQVLRTPLQPSESFSDDPLRMMRAARFVARLGVVPAPDVVAAMTAMNARLDVVSHERVRDELDKLLGVADPRSGLELLVTTGLADRCLPELVDGPIDAVVAARPDAHFRLAVLLAGHGESAARHRLRSLRHSGQVVDRVARLVSVASSVGGHGPVWTDGELRRLAHRAGAHLADVVELLGLVGLPNTAVAALRSALADLATRDDLDDLRPALDGQQVMEILGLSPGRDVGAALEFLQQVRFDDGMVDRDTAVRLVSDWWAARPG